MRKRFRVELNASIGSRHHQPDWLAPVQSWLPVSSSGSCRKRVSLSSIVQKALTKAQVHLPVSGLSACPKHIDSEFSRAASDRE
jgi:hypothetical protein